jgi:hypothetical protein
MKTHTFLITVLQMLLCFSSLIAVEFGNHTVTIESLTETGEKRSLNLKAKGIWLESKSGERRKENVELFVQDYMVRIKQTGFPRLASNEWGATFVHLELENGGVLEGDRGVWIQDKNLSLFSDTDSQLYLVWKTETALCFKELLKHEDKREFYEKRLMTQQSNEYAIPVNYMAGGQKVSAETKKDARNLEVVNIQKKDETNITVTVKSKLTRKEFIYVVDEEITQKYFEEKNKKIEKKLTSIPPSWIRWKLSEKDLADARKLEKQGFRYWGKDGERIFAKLVAVKKTVAVIEDTFGKQKTLSMSELREEDIDYLTEKKAEEREK